MTQKKKSGKSVCFSMYLLFSHVATFEDSDDGQGILSVLALLHHLLPLIPSLAESAEKSPSYPLPAFQLRKLILCTRRVEKVSKGRGSTGRNHEPTQLKCKNLKNAKSGEEVGIVKKEKERRWWGGVRKRTVSVE